jgi:hypothetical protein
MVGCLQAGQTSLTVGKANRGGVRIVSDQSVKKPEGRGEQLTGSCLSFEVRVATGSLFELLSVLLSNRAEEEGKEG